MSAPPAIDDAAVAQLAAFASTWTGFSPEAILPDAIRKAALALLASDPSVARLLTRARELDPAVVHGLRQAVSVGETYFFRQPDHFRWLGEELVPELLLAGRAQLTAWSAGCATGEEAYSLAATLLDCVPAQSGVAISVLGTDLLEKNLAAARAANYGAWSRRASGPILHPLLRDAGPGRLAIEGRVRQAVRFELHNLLDPAPAGPFEVILCRNVLVYFAPEAARAVARQLAAAVAPGGALVFGALDLALAPVGFHREGPPELQIYRRDRVGPAKLHTPLATPRAAPAGPLASPVVQLAAPRAAPPEPVAVHLRALVLLERGAVEAAEALLSQLHQDAPDYIPGILERALLHARAGRRRAAAVLMREVLARSAAVEEERVLAGPEPLPARYFQATARSYLDREAP